MADPQATYTLNEDEPQQVQIWNGSAWVKQNRLRCETMRYTVQPNNGISQAVLSYDYGLIDINDGNGFTYHAPLEILQKAVRIVVFNATTGVPEARWVGFVTSMSDDNFKQPRPPHTDIDSVKSFGTQQFNVSGPEWLLNRQQVIKSRMDDPYHIGRALPFNIREGRVSQGSIQDFGNMNVLGTRFVKAGAEPFLWQPSDIVSYLFRYHSQTVIDAAGDFGDSFDWLIENAEILDTFIPQLEAQGRTLYQLLNELVSPRRFTIWSVRYEGASDTKFGQFVIRFATTSAQALALPSGKTLAANPRRVTLNTSSYTSARISLTGDASSTYQYVHVQGARLGHVLSQQIHKDPLFKKGWTKEDEKGYVEGAKATMTTEEWEALDKKQKDDRNRLYRSTQFPHVFIRFGTPNGTEFPWIGRNDVYLPALRWQPYIPLREDWDYSKAPFKPKSLSRVYTPHRQMFSVYDITDFLSEEPFPARVGTYCYGDKLHSNPPHPNAEAKGMVSVRVTPLEDAFGIWLEPGGSFPHWHAKAVSIDDEMSGDEQQVFDYETDIFVTGYFQEDHFVSAWASANAVVTSDGTFTTQADELWIQLGDIAFYDILHPETIVEVDGDGRLVKSPDKKIAVRDDRELLKDVARLAYEWYSTQRYAYSIQFRGIVRDVFPGDIAVDIDGATTDAFISEVAWDFNSGQTSIATAYAEPDFRQLASDSVVPTGGRATRTPGFQGLPGTGPSRSSLNVPLPKDPFRAYPVTFR